jgi:hypothetical protein
MDRRRADPAVYEARLLLAAPGSGGGQHLQPYAELESTGTPYVAEYIRGRDVSS